MKITRRRLLKGAAATAGLSLANGFYAWRIEPHWLQIVERTLPIAHLPSSLEGARLAQLSDLHIGPQVDDDYLLETFDRVRAIAPEIVVYTGDFTSKGSQNFDQCRRMFAALPLGSRGTFGVLGNHDYGAFWSESVLADALAALSRTAGVEILRNETADMPGWDSYSSWILAGHTHGGQCKPPFLPPPMLPVKNRRYTSGEFNLADGRRMYINRGVGHLLRVRFNARPEVTLFQLMKA
jgi:predicted MPP superfamily phosphohydrolase